MRKLNAEKATGTDADLEKLKTFFLKMLKEVNDEYAEPKEDISNDEMRAQVKELHRDAKNAKQKILKDLMVHVMKRQRK